MVDRCSKCGATRAEGWVLVKGLCALCGPDEFKARREMLKVQARKLMGDAS